MTKRRKYCPSRNRQRQYADTLATTFFYHGSMMQDVGARCGNMKYALTNDSARAILNRRNTWAGIIIVFCNNGIDHYTKRKLIEAKTPLTRAELNAWVDSEQTELVNTLNINHVCSTGYFIVPDHNADVAANIEQITQLFERENPYDYTVTVLAGTLREKQEAA